MSEPALRYDALIVGCGHGGAAAAIALRQRQFEGSIALLGDEADPPYERPPLSKDYLSDEKNFDRLLIRPDSFWLERQITIRTGARIATIDPGTRTAVTEDGSELGYETLIWAAGARARRLSCIGGELSGVHTLRTRTDVDQLKAELPSVRQVVIIGGGYIGLEVAAVLVRRGKAVTVVEMADRLLKRVAGEPLAAFYLAEHQRQGVSVRLRTTVKALEGKDGSVSAVRLDTGELLEADAVIVGIGVEPNIEPLAEAGAECANGVTVDGLCRTTLPSVFAIGDCAAHRNPYADNRMVRLESVQNARDQADVVARAITGEPRRYNVMPWFWSDQYDLKLQTVGLSTGYDETLVRGDPTTRGFSVVYRKRGRVIALDCVNSTRDYVGGKALVAIGWEGDAKALVNIETPLKSLAP